MNPIFQALSQGHNPQQILRYLSQSIPGMAAPITKATSSGYSAKQILGFLSKNFETEDRRGMSESQIHAVNRRADAERTKHGLTMAAGALAAPLAARAASNALARALPYSVQTPNLPAGNAGSTSGTPLHQPQLPLPQTTATTPTGNQQPTAQQSSSLQTPGQNVIQNIPQTTTIQQPKINISGVLSQNQGFVSKINDLVKAGNKDPKAISGYFKQFHPSEVKKLEKEAGSTIEEMVTDYLSTNQIPEPTELVRQEALGKFNEKVKKPSVLDEETERFKKGYEIDQSKIEKSSTVLSPQGVGEVREIRNGKAIIEVDGKRHQVNESELETSPIPEKELADIYDDLRSKIESETGQEMSRHVTFLGYDPNMKQLIYMPWRGQPYTYNEVTDEEISDLKDKINRKTSGENFIGAYQEGTESPIGAAMSAFIQRRKASQKDVQKKEPIHKSKFEKLYYAYEPAEKEAEARYKERKKQSKKNPRIS